MNTDDNYGNINFMSFLGSVLARLAYFSDYSEIPSYFNSESEEQRVIRSKTFLSLYSCIFCDKVIPTSILNGIGNQTNLDNIFNDPILLNNSTLRSSTTSKISNYVTSGLSKISKYKTNNTEIPKRSNGYIDFIQFAKKINVITGEETGTKDAKIVSQKIDDIYSSGILKKGRVYYTSIGTSNYGEIYIVADQDISNKLFVIFRGTYSAKTASAWSKPSSLVSWTVSEYNGIKESYLYGIFKLVEDTIHTVLQACLDLSQKAFPNARNANAVSIITCGHSLGGAMSTIFAYLWMSVKENQLPNMPIVNNSGKKNPYVSGDFTRLSKQIACISLGSPRVFSKDLSILFCDYVKAKFIVYKRITTRGDPFTGQPYFGFYHACSTSEEMRKEISEDCNQTLLRIGAAGSNYEAKLDCKNVKTRTYAPDPFSHTIYLEILFSQALDYRNTKKMLTEMNEFGNSLKSTNKTSRFNFEVQRDGKSSMCRLLFYDATNANGCNIAFFNMNNVRNNRLDDEAFENKVEQEKSTNNEKMNSVGGGFFDWLTGPSSKKTSTPASTAASTPVQTYSVNSSPTTSQTPPVQVNSVSESKPSSSSSSPPPLSSSSSPPPSSSSSSPLPSSSSSSFSSYFSKFKSALPSSKSFSSSKKYQDVSEDVRITTPVFNKLKQISQFVPFYTTQREPMNFKDYPNAVLSMEDLNSLAPPPLSQYIVISKMHITVSLSDQQNGGTRTRKRRKIKKRKTNKRKTRINKKLSRK